MTEIFCRNKSSETFKIIGFYKGASQDVPYDLSYKALDYCIENDIFADFFRGRRNEVVGMILEEYTLEHVEQRTARKVERLTKELEDTQQELQEANQTIADKDSKLQSKDAEIQSKDVEIARLKQLINNNND